MRILGLVFVGIKNVSALRNADLAASYETHAIGGGEWSIEALGRHGELLTEFVGLNGTQDEEEATDLWAEVSEWEKQEIRPAYSYKEFVSPDGTTGSISFFRREAEKGHLHGCVVSF